MEIALLGLRLVVGLAFAAHGAQKLFGAFGGDGIGGTARAFERIGLRPGNLHAWMAGTTEFLGGLLIALGGTLPALGALGAGVLGGLGGAVLGGRLAPGRDSGRGRGYGERQAA